MVATAYRRSRNLVPMPDMFQFHALRRFVFKRRLWQNMMCFSASEYLPSLSMLEHGIAIWISLQDLLDDVTV